MTEAEDPLVAFLRRLSVGTRRTNAELIAALTALRVDDSELDHATRLVCRLLTKEPYSFMQACLGASHWRARIDDPSVPARVMRMTASRINRINQRVFELYEADFGSTRATMHHLDAVAQHNEHMVPYLEVLLQNAAAAIFGVHEAGPERLADHWVPQLFDDRGRLVDWVDAVVARGDALKHYGGDTNTIIGIYDWIRDDPGLGFLRIPKDVERLDLGAGFGTPYVEDLFGGPFTALDLHPPADARRLGLTLALQRGRRDERRALTPEEHEQYFRRLEAQPWIKYDIFAQPLPTTSDRLLVASFGFLSSTVVSLSPLQQAIPPRLRPLHTTYTAVRRVLEPVAAGKDVSLFTLQRATARAYMNRAVFLRFVEGRLVDHGLAAEPHQGRYVRGVVPIRRPRRNKKKPRPAAD